MKQPMNNFDLTTRDLKILESMKPLREFLHEFLDDRRDSES